MALLERQGGDLVVTLSAFEKVAAVHGDVRVPWSCVRHIRVTESPLREVPFGVRVGTGIPGFLLVGTWRPLSRRPYGKKTFAAARRGEPGVVVELDGAEYRKLVVSRPDAAEVAASLARDLGRL